VDGLRVTFRALNTNTGASTINVSSLGVKSIRLTSGAALAAGDITAGSPLDIIYSTSTGFFHVGPNSSASATAAATSATNAATSATNAATSATNAASSASTASTQATNSSTSATNSAASATTATNYAIKVDDYASGTDNSSKSWAIGGTGNGEPTDGNAKLWATKDTTAVSGSSYSAKEMATGDATASGGSAKAWAVDASSPNGTSEKSAKTLAAEAAASASAASALANSTSTTSLVIATGAKAFTTQASKQYAAGQFVLAVSAADSANYMHGQITSYSGTSLVAEISNIGGSGTLTDWNISVSGSRGAVGAGVGTVTSVSVATANGISGTVADSTSTPAITIIVGAISLTSATGLPTDGMVDSAVTYAKVQDVAASSLLGRATASSGVTEEITLGTNLSFTGTTLNAAGSVAVGSTLYLNALFGPTF